MSMRPIVAFVLGALAMSAPGGALLHAAPLQDSTNRAPGAADSVARPPAAVPLFSSEAPLDVTLTGNLGRLRRDKADGAPWRQGTIQYTETNGGTREVPLRMRTRGIWRLKNCDFPPLRFNFGRRAVRGTVFEGLDEPKMVNFCKDRDNYEQYVLQELQLYRMFALLTPVSHRARLLRTTYWDSARGATLTTRYAILVEEPDAMAARVGGRLIETKGAKAEDLDPYQAALVGVFQYLIGNHDWSTANLHNAELVVMETVLPVPYDFDFSGAVNAVYATPDPNLPIRRVRDRLYRGHCVPEEHYNRVFALFRDRKEAIYALYADEIGQLLEPRVVRETLEYYDRFYETLGSDRLRQRDILDRCQFSQ